MSDNIFHLFGRSKPDPDKKKPYQAFNPPDKADESYNGVTLSYEDGTTREVIFFGYLMRVISTDETHVNLITTEGVYIITGRLLGPVIEGLLAKTIRFLNAWNASVYNKEPADDAPKINRIEFYTHEAWWALLRARNEAMPSDVESDSSEDT